MEEKNSSRQGGVKKSNEKIALYFNKYFKLILVASMVLVFVLSYFFFAPSLINQYAKINESIINEKKIELGEHKNVLRELNKLNDIYESISPSLKEKVLNLLPMEVDLANLYYNLEQLSSDANYELKEIEVVLPKDEQIDKDKSKVVIEKEDLSASLKEIKINLKLNGYGYLNLKNFVSLVEKNLRIFDIESVNYDATKSDVELKLRAYYYN